MRIARVVASRRFDRDYRGLDANRQAAVDQAIRDLCAEPRPASLRFHPLHGYKPKRFVVDIDSHHSWQMFLEIEGDTATPLSIRRHPK